MHSPIYADHHLANDLLRPSTCIRQSDRLISAPNLESPLSTGYTQQGMKTLQEIEQAIATLPLPDRLRLYKDMPHLIALNAEDLDWQSLALEGFFQDDSPDDRIYDHL